MKKLNLLAIALLFTMTAKAHEYKSTTEKQRVTNILKEACKARKNISKCLENSTNFEELATCGSTIENQFPDGYSEIDIENLIEKNGKLIFSYRIVLDDQHTSSWSSPLQINLSSCVDNEFNKISADDLSKNFMNAIYPATKKCTLLLYDEINKLQDCE